MTVIRLPAGGWKPRDSQRKLWGFLERGGRRAVELAHRRWGKDEVALHRSAVVLHERVGNVWHCLPLFAQARKTIWTAVNPHTGIRRIDEAFPQELRALTNEQEMFIRFLNGSTWQVIGSDTYNHLVGASVNGVVFSEWALANPSAWAFIAPILAENDGWALFITTPRGRNHAKTTYDMARGNPGWFAEVSTVADTGFPLEIVEAQREEYRSIYGTDAGDALIEQEYWCSFEAAILGSYWGKELVAAEREGRIRKVDADPNIPVDTVWDLGVGDSTSIWFFQMAGAEIHIVDFYEASGYGIEHYANIKREKRYNYGVDYVPHDAKQRSFTSSGRDGKAKQRIEVMIECGLRPVLVPDHKVIDGINAARQTLPRCWFDEGRCENGLEALRQYQAEWDDDKKVFRDRPLHNWASHAADSFRYLSIAWKQRAPAKLAVPVIVDPLGRTRPIHPCPKVLTKMTYSEFAATRGKRREMV